MTQNPRSSRDLPRPVYKLQLRGFLQGSLIVSRKAAQSCFSIPFVHCASSLLGCDMLWLKMLKSHPCFMFLHVSCFVNHSNIDCPHAQAVFIFSDVQNGTFLCLLSSCLDLTYHNCYPDSLFCTLSTLCIFCIFCTNVVVIQLCNMASRLAICSFCVILCLSLCLTILTSSFITRSTPSRSNKLWEAPERTKATAFIAWVSSNVCQRIKTKVFKKSEEIS